MKYINTVLLAGVLALFGSCSMSQEVTLDRSGAGEVVFSVGMASYLGDVIEQMGMLIDPEAAAEAGSGSFFDVPAIREGFESNKKLSAVTVESPDRLSLNGGFRFTSVEDMVKQANEGTPGTQMISFSSTGSESQLTVLLNRATVSSMIKSNPELDNPLVQMFGPSSTEGMSEEDYLDMMEFGLGEESRKGIIASKLSLTVKVTGEILEQRGGTKLNSSAVRFDIPLLDILLLENTAVYSLRYR